MQVFLDQSVSALGRLDIVCANAGISTVGRLESLAEIAWQDMIDINLTGVWHTCKAAVPHLRAASGGSIIITSSVMAVMGRQNVGHYSASKHGSVGLMKSLALELGPDMIRVNCVAPTNVPTDLLMNKQVFAAVAPDLSPEQRTMEVVVPRMAANHSLPVPWVETSDVANAALWLASDEARYVTGAVLPVDAGRLLG
jgi:NAD(P)-dependent dehydrogenase (short-subunit alcohol dehydrogenase family)